MSRAMVAEINLRSFFSLKSVKLLQLNFGR